MESARKRMRVEAGSSAVQEADAADQEPMDTTIDAAGSNGNNMHQAEVAAPQPAATPAAEAQHEQQRSEPQPQDNTKLLQQQQQQQQQQKLSKKQKKKHADPSWEISGRLMAACKQQQCRQVLQIYEEALASNIQLPQHVISAVLYQTACGDAWEKLARRNLGQPVDLPDDALTPDDVAYVTSKAGSIVDDIHARGWKLDEMHYTGMARVALLQGQPEEALQWALKAKAAGQPVRLRSYHPALVGFAHHGTVEESLKVLQVYQAADIDLTEVELRYMLEALAKGGSYQQFTQLAALLTDNLNALDPATVAHIREFFSSSRAAAAVGEAVQQAAAEAAARQQEEAKHGKPAGAEQQQEQQQEEQTAAAVPGEYAGWEVAQVEVADDGSCEAAGGKLRVVELSEADWDTFADSIAKLAASKEAKKDEFKKFQEWYDKAGPYDVLVDGANVALYGQNMDGGGFRTEQIRAVVEQVRQDMPGARVLVLLHVRRLKEDNITRRPENQKFIDELKASKSFTFTPPGSNDDWYWLYATVKAKSKGLLVSNDLLRDHIFQLLRPKHFIKWSERHIVRYSFTPAVALGLQYPAPYTACVQQLANGAWMVPCSDGTWLCAKPKQAAVSQ